MALRTPAARMRPGILGTAIVGVILVIVGGDAATGAGIVLIGIAVIVVLANLMIRLAISSQRDREREEERRERPTAHRR